MARKPHRHAPPHTLEHKHRILSGLLLAFAFVAIIAFASRDRFTSASPQAVDLTGLQLEIADEDVERVHGLSGREGLGEEEGMLFVFDQPGIYPFWMKDMSFPLDIVWINGDEVVDVVTLQPPTRGSLAPPRHIPFKKADQVLELNAGEAEEYGLEVGSKVILP